MMRAIASAMSKKGFARRGIACAGLPVIPRSRSRSGWEDEATRGERMEL
jgi:hypothetical protein